MNWTVNLTSVNTTTVSALNGMKDTDLITKFCSQWAWYEIGMWVVLLLMVVCKLIAGRIRKKRPEDVTVIMLYGVIDDMVDMTTAAIAALYITLLIMGMM